MPTSSTLAPRLRGGVARLILLIALLLAGLSAGFFYTYEVSVTRGLAEVGDPAYVETFKAINATVRNAPFGLIFFGPVPAIALAVAANVRRLRGWARWSLVAAVPLYVATIAITIGGNVVLNDELAQTDPAAASAARADFEDDWNRLNLIRTVTAVGTFVAVAGAALAPLGSSSPGTSPDGPSSDRAVGRLDARTGRRPADDDPAHALVGQTA